MVKFVYKFLPAFVTYTDSVKENFAGETKFIFIKIRPKYRDDPGLLEHELTHVRQCYRLLLIYHGLLYRFSSRYRLNAEIEAYANQIKTNLKHGKPSYLTYYVGRILELYNIENITYDQVKRKLEKKLLEA